MLWGGREPIKNAGNRCIYGQYRSGIINFNKLDEVVIVERLPKDVSNGLGYDWHLYAVPKGFSWEKMIWEIYLPKLHGMQCNFARIHKDYVEQV